eukprot:scaffold35545_cov58-Phaeocystis_antarctica.AAC.1
MVCASGARRATARERARSRTSRTMAWRVRRCASAAACHPLRAAPRHARGWRAPTTAGASLSWVPPACLRWTATKRTGITQACTL